MFKVRITGPLAIFTRPELKVERISYPVITPSAARGVLEAVFWKPAIAWHVHRISVLSPVQWMAFRRNEVSSRAVRPAEAVLNGGGTPPVLFADEDRAQRNTVALRDVDYQVEASFTLTRRASPGENETKFREMFLRRLRRGQHFHQPYLGCRECIADVQLLEESVDPIPESRDLGLMLYDIDFTSQPQRPLFFHAQMVGGVIQVPTLEEVRANSAEITS